MTRWLFARCAQILAAAALAACDNGVTAPSAPAQAQTLVLRSGAPIATHPDRRASWISADASSSQDLLYVSDIGDFDVKIYGFPSLKLVGRLTGFDEPQGECSDTKGDVWITNTLQYQIIEYPHGEKTPIAVLSDPVGYPVGCAVDSTTGNLAVTNLLDGSGSGSVIVYQHASGTPTPYGNSGLSTYYFAGYDSKGDLYVSAMTDQKAYALAVLRYRSSSLSLVTLKGATLYIPGTVTFAGSHLVLGDQECKGSATSCLYRASLSGNTATITGVVTLKDSCDVAQAWVGPVRVAAGDYADYRCVSRTSRTQIWSYPGGTLVGSAGRVSHPAGTTVSQSAGAR
jgi:hypothetical protein